MKNRELKPYRYPTTEELYAYERAARAARAQEMGRLVRSAFARLAQLFAVKGVRHA